MLPDVFNSNAFSMQTLTDSILAVPLQPTRIGDMGIFQAEGVATTSIQLEFDGAVLSLIPSKLRGEDATKLKTTGRTLRTLQIPHFPLEDRILPEEIQNVRAFGGSQLQGVQAVVNQRLARMAMAHDATAEYMRIGALKGIVYDSDGSTVMYNLFTEFELTQTPIAFALGTDATEVLLKCLEVKRAVEVALGGLSYQAIRAVCGAGWFDKFVSHPTVKAAYALWQQNGQQGAFLRGDMRSGFSYGGITFEEYNGAVNSIHFVGDQEAHFFPVGVPGLFRTVYAPATFLDQANSIGLPRYARSEPGKYNKWLDIYTESNPLSYCTRPKVLQKGTTN